MQKKALNFFLHLIYYGTPEYKIIWVTPPDPVKLGTIMGEIYARGRGLEFVGLVPNEKKCGGAK